MRQETSNGGVVGAFAACRRSDWSVEVHEDHWSSVGQQAGCKNTCVAREGLLDRQGPPLITLRS
eukprot:620157-Amphidinium_carterae.2